MASTSGLSSSCHGDIAGAIGNTPLLYLKGPSRLTGCHIWGKAEFLNPGGSIKDRTALGILVDARERGQLGKGDLVVEGSAGNTGIGLSLVGAAMGCRCLIVVPETQSVEKVALLGLYGAGLRLVPAVPAADPRHYVNFSKQLARELGGFWANQFDNVANRMIHYRTTGPEIWEQTGGRIDAFVCSVGTGGSLAGIGEFLREKSSRVRIALADPEGSALHAWYCSGCLEAQGSSVTEGIGQGRLTGNLRGFVPDMSFRIPDHEAISLLHRLSLEEGICVGGSSAINIAGAIRLGHRLGEGHTIVTLLCDSGSRYASKLFNPAFLAENGLPAWPAAGEAGKRDGEDTTTCSLF